MPRKRIKTVTLPESWFILGTKVLAVLFLLLAGIQGSTQNLLSFEVSSSSHLIFGGQLHLTPTFIYSPNYTNNLDTNQVLGIDSVAFFVSEDLGLKGLNLYLMTRRDFYPPIKDTRFSEVKNADTVAYLDTSHFQSGWNWIKLSSASMSFGEYFSFQLAFSSLNSKHCRMAVNLDEDIHSRSSLFLIDEEVNSSIGLFQFRDLLTLKFKFKEEVGEQSIRYGLSEHIIVDSTLNLLNYSTGFDKVICDFGDQSSMDITKRSRIRHEYTDTGSYVLKTLFIKGADSILRIDSIRSLLNAPSVVFPCRAQKILFDKTFTQVFVNDYAINTQSLKVPNWQLQSGELMNIKARRPSGSGFDELLFYVDTNRNGSYEASELFVQGRIDISLIDSFTISIPNPGTYAASFVLCSKNSDWCSDTAAFVRNIHLFVRKGEVKKPQARFLMEEKVDGRIVIKDVSKGEVTQRRWRINGVDFQATTSVIYLDALMYPDSLQVSLILANSHGSDTAHKSHQTKYFAIKKFGSTNMYYQNSAKQLHPSMLSIHNHPILIDDVIANNWEPINFRITNGRNFNSQAWQPNKVKQLVYFDYNNDSVFSVDERIAHGDGIQTKTIKNFMIGLDSMKRVNGTYFLFKDDSSFNMHDPTSYPSHLITRIPFVIDIFALDAKPIVYPEYKGPLVCDGEFFARAKASHVSLPFEWILDNQDTIVGEGAYWQVQDTGLHQLRLIARNYYQTTDTVIYFRSSHACDTFYMVPNQTSRIEACSGVVVDEGGTLGPTDPLNYESALVFSNPKYPQSTYDIAFDHVILNEVSPESDISTYDRDEGVYRRHSTSLETNFFSPIVREITDSLEIFYRGRGYAQEGYVLSFACFYDPSAQVSEFTDKRTKELNVYPNPNSGTFSLEGLDDYPVNIEIYSLKGQRVHSENIREGQLKLQLPSGFYTLKAYGSHEVYSSSFIVVD